MTCGSEGTAHGGGVLARRCLKRHLQQRRCGGSGMPVHNNPTTQQVRIDSVRHAGGSHRSPRHQPLSNQLRLEIVGVHALAIAEYAHHAMRQLACGFSLGWGFHAASTTQVSVTKAADSPTPPAGGVGQSSRPVGGGRNRVCQRARASTKFPRNQFDVQRFPGDSVHQKRRQDPMLMRAAGHLQGRLIRKAQPH